MVYYETDVYTAVYLDNLSQRGRLSKGKIMLTAVSIFFSLAAFCLFTFQKFVYI